MRLGFPCTKAFAPKYQHELSSVSIEENGEQRANRIDTNQAKYHNGKSFRLIATMKIWGKIK